MRAFLLACAVAVVLAAGAAYALHSGYLPNASSAVFSSSQSVRI